MRKFLGLLFFLSLASSAFAIRPSHEYAATPAMSGISYDSLNIATADHYRLTGWYCKAPKDLLNCVIVMAGGDAGNMSYELPLVKFLTDNFNAPVLLFDYRGFGTSQDFQSDSNAIGHPEYLSDLDAAVAYAQR